MLILSFAGVVLFSLVLIRSTDLLTGHLKALARKTALGEFFLTSFLIGLATSLPEISVGITSALEGVPNISLGNVIGSNIANLSIITGVATLISGALTIRKHTTYTTDFVYALFAGIAPVLLLIDGELTRVDGMILLLLYGYYNYALLQNRVKTDGEEDVGFVKNLIHRMNKNHTGKNIKYIFLSLTLIIFSSDMIVRNGEFIASGLGIPVFLIGLFLVAIGTSLPELAFSVRSIKCHEPELFMGNLLGSTVANATFIVGLTALICPIAPVSVSEYLIAIMVFLVIVISFLAFSRSKNKLTRREGLVLIGIYLVFVLLEAYQHFR
jgi:cation:H+ antiporter